MRGGRPKSAGVPTIDRHTGRLSIRRVRGGKSGHVLAGCRQQEAQSLAPFARAPELLVFHDEVPQPVAAQLGAGRRVGYRRQAGVQPGQALGIHDALSGRGVRGQPTGGQAMS